MVSTASPYKFAQDVYKAITGKEEADAFRAIDKLAEYSATDVPEVIAALKGKEVLHNGELKRENIKNSILELFGCTH